MAADSTSEKIKPLVEKSLLEAQQNPNSGLSKIEDVTKRFLDLVPFQKNWQIHINSDGLTLDNKIILERYLLMNLAQEEFKDFSVYFKSFQNQNQERKPATPRDVSDNQNPYGLKIKKRAIPFVRRIIVVASGKGGVGKSTVSAQLAMSLARMGRRVGLLDADVYGPSAPKMLGLQGHLKINEDQRLIPLENWGVRCMSYGFFSDSTHPVLWRGPLISKAIHQMCYQVEWGELDELIVDLPPGTGDVQLSLIEYLPIHGAIIVTTGQEIALIDAHKAVSMFETLDTPILGVVGNMNVHVCSQCTHEDYLYGKSGAQNFADSRKLKILTEVPLLPDIIKATDQGKPVDPHKCSAFNELAHIVTEWM